MFRPNLLDCMLEERIAPAIANFGVIILTTTGYSLLIPFPGTNSTGSVSGAGGQGVATSAHIRERHGAPTSFYITGTNGISSASAGQHHGRPESGRRSDCLRGCRHFNSGRLGPDSSDGAAPTNVVSRNTVANPTQRPDITPDWPDFRRFQLTGATAWSNLPGQRSGASADAVWGIAAPAIYTRYGHGRRPVAPNPMSGAPTLGPASGMRAPSGVVPGTVAPMPPGIN